MTNKRKKSEEEYFKWIQFNKTLKYPLKPMTRNQSEFAIFLLENIELLDQIGSNEEVFKSITRYCRETRYLRVKNKENDNSRTN